jgi:WD40 repeat protein
MALSPDGRQLASAGRDANVKLWDAEPSHNFTKLPIRYPVASAFARDGHTLTTVEARPWFIARWDLRSASLISRKPIDLPEPATNRWTALSLDVTKLSYIHINKSVALWNTITCQQESPIDSGAIDPCYSQFSPDNRYLLIHDMARRPTLWDIRSQRAMPVPWDGIEGITFAPGGELVIALQDGRLVCWEPSSDRKRSVSTSVPGGLANLTFSSDGGLMASVDAKKGRILLWSGTSFALIKELPGHGVIPFALAFSPDRKTLASDGDDRTTRLWDIETGEQLLALELNGKKVYDPCFSPDGTTLTTVTIRAGNQQELLLWRTATFDSNEGPERDAVGGPDVRTVRATAGAAAPR